MSLPLKKTKAIEEKLVTLTFKPTLASGGLNDENNRLLFTCFVPLLVESEVMEESTGGAMACSFLCRGELYRDDTCTLIDDSRFKLYGC